MRVTGFVKYDVYPYYVVIEGELHDNFDLATNIGVYSRNKVIKVAPFSEFESHVRDRALIIDSYKCREADLKLAILQEHGVDFIKLN